MQERIAKGLSAAFDRHRIVFWTDTARELREAYEAVSISDLQKIEIANNEFAVKHRILREEPEQKFLLYREGPEPAKVDNWLLDVQISHGSFKADQAALWLGELGLGLEMEEIVRSHVEFFRSSKRLEQLKRIIKPDDTASALRLKMLCVCAKGDSGFDSVVEVLLAELTDETDETMRLIGRAGLEPFLWDQMGRHYGYHAGEPGIDDLAVTLFKSCYAMGIGGEAALSPEALVFFKRWKNNRHCSDAFEKLSATYGAILGIEQDLSSRDFRGLIELDYFEDIDRAIIASLVRGVADKTLPHADVVTWIRQRRQGHWYDGFSNIYEAIGYAAEFQASLAQLNLGMTSLAEGVERYATNWFRIDQLYRKFIYHMQKSGQASLLSELFGQVENHYVNSYLLRLNEAWQSHVDSAEKWDAAPIVPQRAFYETHVAAFRRKDQKICVIISDALRYEVAEELLGRVRALDRYDADLEPMLGSLPSYTQLGMASLLPNKDLQIADNDTSSVLVDGQSSQGLQNRKKILAKGREGDRTTALGADDLLKLHKDDCRALFKEHDVIYVYHNRIDAIGDKLATEESVFSAAEETLDQLIQIVRKLTAANASSLLITADHGFIYQHRPIEESDFSGSEVVGDTVLFRNRRFVLGHGLQAQQGLRKYTASEAGLEGNVEILIPKSINRLRVKGSGSRFVHGGSTLQETVVPVVRINKKRQSDTSVVEVEIISGANQTITSSQISVVFYQAGPMTDKAQPRMLRAGIFSQSGELLSDSHDLTFDFRSDNPRERELPVRFLLSRKADEFNSQEVVLRLEEQHGETSHFRDYRSVRYILRRSFTNDFDF